MKRALTAYSRLPNEATVVGTSKLGFVIVRVTDPLPKSGARRATAIWLFWFWTT